MIIPRLLTQIVLNTLEDTKKGVLIYGARQVGKTTLTQELLRQLPGRSLTINGDLRGSWWEAFTSRELPKLQQLIGGYDNILIDEAQRIPEVGLTLKIIRDYFPEKKLIITGSSSIDLASSISEPLTGRVYTYKLFPISQEELSLVYPTHSLDEHLELRLVFGSYPEIFSLQSREQYIEYITNIVNSYLYKDLLELGDIKNLTKIYDLLKLLAFQIGSEVSVSELAQQLELSRNTVDRYIDLLEKSFVLYRLSGFSRNLRKEVAKKDKIYFYDVGIRNALINNFHLLNDRDDVGKLWENFLIIERVKKSHYHSLNASYYFWRLSSGAEIDLVEEYEGGLHGFECKWGNKVSKIPSTWQVTYPESTYTTVNRDNWLSFTGIIGDTLEIEKKL